jgi:1-acyl-sn-glycerol-3-phosphate acyltransferase
MNTLVLTRLKELKEHAIKANQELARLAELHPLITRKMFSVGNDVFQKLFASSTYRKFWNFYQLWKYADEQHYYEVDEFGMDDAVREVVLPFFQFLYYQYFRVETEGTHNIALNGPALLIANHSGSIAIYDGSIVNLAVMNNHPAQRWPRYLVDDFIYYLPFMGTFLQRTGGIRACHENAMRLLDHGHIVTVFPEGIKGVGKLFDQRYQLQRFGRGGYVRLAMRAGVPIIPTAIIGAEEIHPMIWKSERIGKIVGLPYFPFTLTFPWLGPLGLIPLPTKWRIIFGAPISFAKYSPHDADNDALVMKVNESIKSTIQKMIDKALKQRESVWY